ncbi:NACHT domain-containing NTPase [Streptomyces sp. NBC_01285]|uniref:NACHT domain-containing protein n=1 Tax=Streptomyces sp. NBC_01285 TaxID=2903813 RepID=UPI002257F648|nr:NACHT domain-containing protein [Streptomyces sp. NBC_01285]MCX4775012.1 NACHT domain-containing protein [Streptomyces sp. NBC_01285]
MAFTKRAERVTMCPARRHDRVMLELGERRDRRKWQVVRVACAVLVVAGVAFAVWSIASGRELKLADVATLIGVPIAVTSLVVAVVALHKPVEDNSVELARSRAGRLARQVRESESPVRSQLLGADTRRINLTYVLQSAAARGAAAPPAGRTFADGPATLPDVLEYYRSTQPRRLVVTGAAGAGKTVLALELMLALIDHRAEGDPVPVRIPLAQWNTDQPLTTLLVQRLTDAYKWPADMAAGLVAHGMVLPVLDGLDEMDPLLADGTPNPDAPRARKVLEALNAYQDGREAGPLVLTCRTGHYDALAPLSRLIDAARVAIAPIDTRHTVAYLRDRAMDTPRWQPLIDHLDTQPAGPLATTLSTPWRLCLTATVYHRDGNPSELLHHTDGHDLDQHLLARYIPATIANTPNPHDCRPEDVHRWLHHLTGHLAGTTTNTSATDITLHQLWTLAGTTRVRITDLTLTTVALALALTAASFFTLLPFLLSNYLGRSIGTGIFLHVFAAVSVVAFRPTPRPNRLRINRGTLQDGFKARFWAGSKSWFAVGFATGFTIGFTIGFTTGFTTGLRSGLVNSLVNSLMSELPSQSPDTVFVFGLWLGLGLGIGTSLVGGFMGGLGGGFADGFKAWFKIWFTVAFVVVLGLNLGLDTGLGLGEGPSLWLGIGLAGGLAGGIMRGLTGEPTTVSNPRDIIHDDLVYGLLIGPLAGLLAGFLGRV